MSKFKYIPLTLLMLGMHSTSHAGSEMQTLIEMLHENGVVSETQYARLQSELEETQRAQAQKAKALAAREQALDKREQQLDQKLSEVGEAGEDSGVEISPEGGLAVRSRDGDFATRIGGRIQADAATYDGDGDYGDGTDIRRARLGISGHIYRDWFYKLEYDFDGESIADGWLSYRGLGNNEFKAGHFKDPFSLQEQTSSNNTVFTERALPSAFATGRHIGVMASHQTRHWTMAAGTFGDRIDASGADEDEGWGWGARATWAPVNNDNRLLHFGLGLNYRDLQPENSARFSQRPETAVSAVRVVDTDTLLDADSQFKTGLEVAATAGSWSAQAEYIRTEVERDGFSDADFDGWYLQGSYFLTGESRPYKNGKFGGITPNNRLGDGGIGAWQLAARLSEINLNDGLVRGGEARAMTLGLNWYPVPMLRFSANYIDVLDVDDGPQAGQEPRIVQFRSQWAF